MQQSNFITNRGRLLLQSASGITKCGRLLLQILFYLFYLKLYLPLVPKIAFANKFQQYHKIKYIIYCISVHIKHPQSISSVFLILFLNSNNESLDFTTAGRLFHI